VLAGFPLADPLVGMLITVAILFILKDAGRQILHRMMDAVEPELVEGLERAALAVPGVRDAHDVRLRWLGHTLHAELHITVDEDLPTRESHRLAEEVRHALLHAQPRLAVATVQVDACGHGGEHAGAARHHAPAVVSGPAR
jgi:divalent metal cation (Fe/Co/Zn/Cd) transporter